MVGVLALIGEAIILIMLFGEMTKKEPTQKNGEAKR